MWLGQEVWVWPGLAEWGQDQGVHVGQEKALDSRRDGWPPRGHFLPGNILLGSRREEGSSPGRQEGPGAQVPSFPRPLIPSGRSQEGMSYWKSEPLELPTYPNLELLAPNPLSRLSSWFPTLSAVSSFHGQELRPQSRFSSPYEPWPEPMPPMDVQLWRRGPGAWGEAHRQHPMPQSSTQAIRLGLGRQPSPSCPCSGPREGVSSPAPPQWPKYNLSRRLAGNRDLCQLPAGVGGRKVSVIGRGAGQAGSQTWVM